MDERLLFSRPRRQKWPRKNPSIIKVMTAPVESLKPQNTQHFQPPSTMVDNQFQFASLISWLLNAARSEFATYLMYEIIGTLGSALLYSPLDCIALAISSSCKILRAFPAPIGIIVIPTLLLYLAYQTVWWILDGYQEYIDLGCGGTPTTPAGFCKVALKYFFARVDILQPPRIPRTLEPHHGRLVDLKTRDGPRPIIRGVAPQRQVDQEGDKSTFQQIMHMLHKAASDHPNLEVTKSYLEGHNEALKGIFPDRIHKVFGTDGEWDFEIAHPHRMDGSSHFVLHPEDCRTVIDQGWGEKHSLATDSVWWRIFYHSIICKRRPVPYNLVLVYAPRNDDEFKVIQQILDAAIWFSNGIDLTTNSKIGHAKPGSLE